jgi:hypothetical protein
VVTSSHLQSARVQIDPLSAALKESPPASNRPWRSSGDRSALPAGSAALAQKDLALRKLVDEAGNALADAIAANTDEWTEAAELVAGEREDEISALFDELEGKLSELGIARRSVEWLESFNVGEAHIGRVQQFSGGTVRIDLNHLHGLMTATKALAALRDKVKEQFRQKVAA